MTRLLLFLLMAICALSPPSHAEDAGASGASPNFGGPDAVESQIADDSKLTPAMISERPFQPWFDWKASLTERTGISFRIDCTGTYRASNNEAGNANASGGMLRFFGSRDLIGRGTKNTRALVWKVDHRHCYSDFSPNEATQGPMARASCSNQQGAPV